MANRSPLGTRYTSTCLRTSKKDHNITDEYLHYTGCLKISERDQYLSTLPEASQRRILDKMEKAKRLRARLETLPENVRVRQLHRLLSEYRKCRNQPVDENDGRLNNTIAPLEGTLADSLNQAPVMFFKDGNPCDVPGLDDCFPNQELSVEKLLTHDRDKNPLMMKHDPKTIRYFHLPANNMAWIEEIMARHYGEQRQEGHDRDVGTKRGIILGSEFWQAQRCFDSASEVHARHMRAFCDSIPTGPGEPDLSNMVLFMPYLHWETDIGRSRTAEKIRQMNEERRKESLEDVVRRAQERQRQVRQSPMPPSAENYIHCPMRPVADSASDSRDAEVDPLADVDLKTRGGRRLLIGLILLTAAEVLEVMDSAAENHLMTDYLHPRHSDLPLHPRRTLDQFYYGSLKCTKTRDRDQVVYRATRPGPPHQGCSVKNYGHNCSVCEEESKMVPRLIMVDQLWLWILDDSTLITSFPRRWGQIRGDTSDVYESLRERLRNVGNNDIQSVHDLALIVIDECSRVFFDRALDKRPQLVDIFTNAIGSLTNGQTAAFDRFLIYSQIVSRELKAGRCHDEATQHILLNIKSEGDLLKEAMDVMDELQIMIRIMEEQQIVVNKFIQQIEQTSLPNPSVASFLLKQTLARAKRLFLTIQSRTNELETLLRLSKKTSAALKDLLTLKQQQAGVIEAREAVRNGEEVYRQGQSIMLFTVVTIIFLPLSFISSLFGMNVAEINDGKLTFSEEFKLMFPIGAGVIIISLTLAFHHSTFSNAFAKLAKSGVSYAYNVTFTWLAVRTGWYILESNITRKTKSLRNKEIGVTGTMKAEALRNDKNIRQMRVSQELMKAIRKEPTMSRKSTFSGTLNSYDTENNLLREKDGYSNDVELGRVIVV